MAALLLSPGTAWDAVGVGAALAGAACMAAGTYFSRRWRPDMPVLAFTGWQLLVGGVILLPIALWADPPMPRLTGVQMLGYAYLCLVGAVVSYGLWFRGLARLSLVNRAKPAPPPAPPVPDDPGKRIASVVPGDPAYLVTADGARYFVGAMLPTGHRITRIDGQHVTLERGGEESTLNF